MQANPEDYEDESEHEASPSSSPLQSHQMNNLQKSKTSNGPVYDDDGELGQIFPWAKTSQVVEAQEDTTFRGVKLGAASNIDNGKLFSLINDGSVEDSVILLPVKKKKYMFEPVEKENEVSDPELELPPLKKKRCEQFIPIVYSIEPCIDSLARIL